MAEDGVEFVIYWSRFIINFFSMPFLDTQF
uniref:Uncharacterized protein n=1 Tax=Anguilla anguilla TaxID=7936 RepID=A0A0E9U2V8_ANGAN